MMPSPQQFDEAECENNPLEHLTDFHRGFFEAREMLSDVEKQMPQSDIDRRAESIVDAIVENQTAGDAIEWLSTMLGEDAEPVDATPPQLNAHTA